MTKAPLSERLCNGLVACFAAFTLCAQAIVALGGTLGQLLGLLVLVAAMAGGGWWRAWHRQQHRLPSDEPVRDSREIALVDDRSRLLLRGVGFALACLAVAGTAWHQNIVVLWWSVLVVLVGASVGFVLTGELGSQKAIRGRGLEGGLYALAMVCVVFALVVNRPDADDAFYINVAVAVADMPQRALLSGDTLHGIEGLPLHQPIYRLHAFDLMAGVVSYLTGISAIAVFHLGYTAIAAFFVPLAAARILRLLLPRDWFWACLVFVGLLMALGETHRWYSNFALVRIWQGKSVYLFVFLPLVYAAAIDYALRPGLKRWGMLAAAQIAAMGCSSSAVWAGPAGALMAMACVLGPTREGLRTLGLGALASSYVLGGGWLLMQGNIEAHDPLLQRARVRAQAHSHYTGQELAEALETVLGRGRLHYLSLVALAGSWALHGPGLARRFAIVLPLATWLILLDPYAGRWLEANLTGPSYWRVMWTLPIPLLISMALVAPLAARGPPRVRAGAVILLTAAVAFAVPRYSVVSPLNRPREVPGTVELGWPSLKVPKAERISVYEWARLVDEAVPPGAPVVVPEYIALWVATFHDAPQPLIVREAYIRKFLDHLGRTEVRPRRVMMRFVEGTLIQPDAADVFRQGLDRFQVRAVILAKTDKAPEARDAMRERGFRPVRHGPEHELWIRSEVPSERREEG
ncbi:DUF6077 domain-containing protein [Myxococcota bacterium]|nr:DUF6077 domain-containing protein [Myxococcota bacterium]